ncbi:MAG: competence/damage-inducible protein A [Anaeromicrobium sp.]|jgi:nicotinamide-nucleotide amidase|uniref:competence/damage-inducible protein A n=1 Tax=Anaeromicrobium sp. TaxID=1929132 RepID=UPI0025DBE9F4|nr:competence/damage-inducible protein A [Anaeromicrobium sp.]MCT4594676.1 competence/damage-inducible protein A [Anaeromicrobium sp.]
MKCAILSIGTELLMGQILNTNSKYLSEELNNLGIGVYYHHTVGDNPKRLEALIRETFKNVDMIITTGGLGPTQDDLTKEIISKVFDREMMKDEYSYGKIRDYFNNRKKIMSKNNIRQAYMPKNSIILENNYGTAPGFIIDDKEKIIICLPGPPKEMKNMFNDQVMKYLMKKAKNYIYSKTIRLFGIGESLLEEKIMDLIENQENPTIATYAKEGEVSIRITSSSKDEDEAKYLVNNMIKNIYEKVGQYIYSTDNEELIDVVVKKLKEKSLTISLAESCTGGMIGSKFTDIPGISSSFDRSLVTYSNMAKEEELGVKKHILEEFGAVSRQTAESMAMGLKRKTKSNICLSVTGIAGPDGGTEEKPVGLVYICLLYGKTMVTRRFHFSGDRNKIRTYTLLSSLNMIKEVLERG